MGAVLATAVIVAVAVGLSLAGPRGTDLSQVGGERGLSVPEMPASAASDGVATAAVALIHRWNQDRGQAWSQGDERSLRALYLGASAVGERDVASLRAWSARGWRVADLTPQISSVSSVHKGEGIWVIDVRELLAAPVAVRNERRVSLPAGQPIERRVRFEWTGGAWVVAAVEVRSEAVQSS